MIVFGICSAINAASNSVYDANERFNQTLKTIESIRNSVDNSYIVLCENTPINEKQKNDIIILVDKFISLYDGDVYDTTISPIPYNHKNKSACELYQTINIISYIKDLEYDLFFKISGRYFLLDDFNIENYRNNKMNFREFNYSYDCYSTVMYSIYKKHEDVLRQHLYSIAPILLNSIKNIETAIHTIKNTGEVNNIPYLGVGGNIAPSSEYLKH